MAAVLATGLVAVTPTSVSASTSTPVMSSSQVSAAQIASWFRSTGKVSKATVSIDELARFFIEEGATEGVAGDLAFAQSIVETGYFGFSARVPPSFNNFSGLGAVDGGTSAASFSSARMGVRAQIHHLRAYADPTVTVSNLRNPLASPRFHLVVPKGRAPLWEQFGGGNWATDPAYAGKVLNIHRQILDHAGVVAEFPPFRSAEALVDQSHRDLLAREATAAERSAAAARLRSGATTPAGLASELISGEGARHGQPVARLYLAALGRLPDRGGLQFWTRQHRSGRSLNRIAEQFFGSSEYVRRFGGQSNAQFVDQLYRNVLGRAGDPGGTDYWTRRLADGRIARLALVVQFSESPEHIRSTAFTTEAALVYLGMMLRQPTSVEVAFWAALRDTRPLREVVDGMFRQQTYLNRFS